MKTKVAILIASLITIFFLLNCGGGSSTSIKDNKYFGKYPSFLKQSYSEAQDIDKKITEAAKENDAKKANELSEKAKQKKKEFADKIETYLDENPIKNNELLFEPLKNTHYTIDKVYPHYKKIPNRLDIVFMVKMEKDTEQFSVYYKALDSKGNEIANSKSVVSKTGAREYKSGKGYFTKAFKAGTELKIQDALSDIQVMNFEDFAKLVEITKEEYNK